MERIEGLSIGLDLETTALNRGLTGLRDKLKNVNSEMRANLSAFDRGDRSIANYETRLTGLNRKLEVQKEVAKAAKQEYERMVQEHGEGSKEADKAARAYNNEVAALNSLERNVERTREELESLREEQRIAESGWTQFGNRLNETGTRLTKVGDSMKNIGKSMSMYVTAPLVGFGTLAAKTGIDFDDSMAKVQAVSGATGKDLLKLRDKAKEMGATTKFSASDSAEALNYMAMAGWKTNDMLDGLDGVMNLAAASGEDLGTVSDIVTDALTAFGMKAKDSGKFADVLAAASSNANTNVSMLGKSFEYAAPVAGALGYTAEDTALALGLMANAGIKADKGGTALRTMMTNLAKPTKQMKGAMDKLGISLTDSKGNMKTLDHVMEDLRKAFKGMDKDQQAAYAATIFGKEAMSGALAVINASEEDYNKLSKAINNSEGAAKKMSEIMEGTLGGAIREIKSGLEGFMISIYETMLPALEIGAEKVKLFVDWLNGLSPAAKMAAVVIGGIAAAIGPLLVVGGMFIGFLGNALTGISKLFPAIARAGGLFKWLKLGLGALTGPIGITIGIITLLVTGFIALYKKSETFRGGVKNLLDILKDLAAKGLEQLKKAVSAVSDFFKEQLEIIKSFWEENKESIMGALKNIGSFISTVFKGILAVIKFVMPVVLAIIKSVWGNIKGVISGALKIIMGVVKIFSGLFTGDFSKMWEGVKQLFSGALEFIWNFMQLMFWGKMVKGVISLGKLLLSNFKSMWKSISGVFSSVIKWIVDFVKVRFTAMQSTISSITTTIKSIISTIWNGILSFFRTIIKTIVDFIRGRFTAIKDTISSIFTTIRNTTQTVWNAIKDRIINPIKSVVSSTKTRFTDMKNQITGIFNGIRTKIGEIVDKMIDTVKGMPKKMGDGLKKTAGKIGDGIKVVANKMTEMLGKGINGVIGGVNWVLDNVGVSSRIADWAPPQYANGTEGHPGGLAIVGDGKGSNAGQELIQTPDGKQFLSPDKPSLINLPKGTHVLSATMTRQLFDIPQYAFGTVKGMWNKGKKAVTKIKDSALNVWDYISNPSKLFNKALEVFGVETPSMPGILKDVGKGAFNKIKNSFKDYMKSKIEDFGSFGDAPTAGKGVQRWAGIASRALAMTGQYTKANLDRLLYQMQTESGGNPKAINLWDINAKRGIPSKGLMQVIDPTFRAYAHPSFNKNIYDPLSNILASIRYATSRYGSLSKAYRGVGYATGGLINNSGLYQLAEEGWPEWVIPTDPKRRTEAMKLLALAGKQIQGNKRPNQLPNVGGIGNSAITSNELLEATLEQNKILKETNTEVIKWLQAIADKTLDIYLGREKIGAAIDIEQAKRMEMLGRRIKY